MLNSVRFFPFVRWYCAYRLSVSTVQPYKRKKPYRFSQEFTYATRLQNLTIHQKLFKFYEKHQKRMEESFTHIWFKTHTLFMFPHVLLRTSNYRGAPFLNLTEVDIFLPPYQDMGQDGTSMFVSPPPCNFRRKRLTNTISVIFSFQGKPMKSLGQKNLKKNRKS